jgi:TolB protein
MDKDGGNQTRLTSGPEDDRAPDVANDYVYYNSNRDSANRKYNIWRVPLHGGQPEFAVGKPDADDTSPAWSPDGTRMVFTNDRDRSGRAIYIHEPGSNPERLTFGGTVDRNPRWHPEGLRLVFTRNANESGARRDIWSLDVETKEASKIATDSADEGGPVYSRDGKQIAYHRRVRGAWHIFIRDLATAMTPMSR